jgi:hypothetical protein
VFVDCPLPIAVLILASAAVAEPDVEQPIRI